MIRRGGRRRVARALGAACVLARAAAAADDPSPLVVGAEPAVVVLGAADGAPDVGDVASANPRGPRGRAFSLVAAESGYVRLELRSMAFDALLLVGDEDGALVASDDDGLGGFDATLVLPVVDGEPLVVWACARCGDAGEATLSARRASAAEARAADDESDALRVARLEAKRADDVSGALRPLPLVVALLKYGRALLDHGRPLDARGVLVRAASVAEGPPDLGDPFEAVAQRMLVEAELDLGDVVAARGRCERLVAALEDASGDVGEDLALALGDLAVLRKETGDYRGAREAGERAADLGDVPGLDPQVRVAQLANLAELLRTMGDALAARERSERALALAEETCADDAALLGTLENALGVMCSETGDDEAARAHYERSLALRETALGPDHVHVAVTLNNLADLWMSAGDVERALPLAERALAISEAAHEDHPDLALSLANLARVVGRDDPARARALFERAVAMFDRVLGEGGPDAGQALEDEAVLALGVGEPDAARALLDRALAGTRAHLATQLAGLSEADGLRLAERTWERLELRTSPMLLADDADAALAYGHLLAWKGQVLRAVRSGRGGSAADVDGATRDALLEVNTRLSNAFSHGADDAELGALLEERGRIERRVLRDARETASDVTWRALRDALPEGAALVDLHVQRVPLAGGGDGRDLAWSEPRAVAWVTRRDDAAPRRVDLGDEAAVAAAAEAWLAPLANVRGRSPARPATTSAAPSLHALLWTPLEPLLRDAHTVFVSPDAGLAAIPFAALRGPDGRYLVEDRAFVSITDPGDIVRVGTRPARARSGDLLVVGDVDFDRADAADGGPPADVDEGPLRPVDERWEALPGTSVEIDAVEARHAATFAGARRTRLAGQAATEEALKAELPRASFLHLATHGAFRDDEDALGAPRRVVSDHPGLLSSLVCAGSNRALPASRDDGFLTADELGWLDLRAAQLVVLSACESALGRPQAGEGMLGLRRALLAAGARSVVTSLWSVPDEETVALMDRFYANLWQHDRPLHEALRAAQLETLADQRARTGGGDPRAWGAFVVDGDWR